MDAVYSFFSHPRYTNTLLSIVPTAQVVRVLLEHGANPNQPNHLGTTPIYFACGTGRPDAFKLLLQHGANPLQPAKDGTTCLHVATERGLVPVLQAVLTLAPHTSIDTRDASGQTLLHYAARNGRLPTLRWLLDRGANHSAQATDTGATPLMLAAQSGAVEAVVLLLDAGADPNTKGGHSVHRASALYLAARRGHGGAVRVLLERGARADARLSLGTTAAFAAAERGDVPLLQLLADHGANFNFRDVHGHSALVLATAGQRHAAMRFLLARGAMSRWGMGEEAGRALRRASCWTVWAAEGRLLHYSPWVVEWPSTPPSALTVLISLGQLYKREYLLASALYLFLVCSWLLGVKVQIARKEDGATPLHIAYTNKDSDGWYRV